MTTVAPTPTCAPRRVAIFGAGVTGLTAAHELVERGFEVEVFEPQPPSLRDALPGEPVQAPCAVGGIARTQWSRVDRPDPYKASTWMVATGQIDLEHERELAEIRFHFPRFDPVHPPAHWFDPTAGDNPAVLVRLDRILSRLRQAYGPLNVQVRGYMDIAELQAEAALPADQHNDPDRRRAKGVAEFLHTTFNLDSFVEIGLGLGSGTDFTVADEERRVVTLHLVQDYIPGEHGFRFFPTFYRNLRDTLKRTPLPVEDVQPFVETFRTVFDNLVPAPEQAVFMYPPRPKYVLPRRRVTSLQELFDLLVSALKTSGFTFSDVNRWALVLFKYMTSCPERRATYESISWSQFVEKEKFSEPFQKYLVATAQGLVAFTPDECDARTYGNITIQLLRDQLIDGEVVDGVLNGPTSLVWLDPWRRYLESQGVRFRRCKLLDFQVVDQVVNGETVQRVFPEVLVEGNFPQKTVIVCDYYLVALPVDVLQKLLNDSAQKAKLLSGCDDANRIVDFELGNEGDAKPNGAMQHLSGIQFYFSTPLNVLHGHSMYPDSEWGLSSISQPQFWVRKRGWWDAYRSLLTVGVGDWHAPSVAGRAAWNCTRDEIAREIWRQIKKSIVPRRDYGLIPDPILYHLDENIVFGSSGTPIGNKTRMLMNLPGTQSERPGRLHRNGYRTWFGNTLVFAGTYMQTYTRLTTMEAANESARHAVNGILRAEALRPDGFKGDRCKIESPEDNELPDVRYFVDLDAELFSQGLPHVVDILSPTELPNDWLKGMLDLTRLASLAKK